MTLNSIRLAGLGVFALVLALAMAPASAETPKVRIVTSGFGAWFYLQQYVAIGAGLYKEEGLDPEVVDVNSGTRQAAAVMGGSGEIGQFSFPHVIKSAAKGGGLVAIATGYDAYPLQLVLSKTAIQKVGITPDMGIDDKIKRLKGLNIGISSPGASTDLFMRTILLVRGIEPDKEVALQPVGGGAPMVGAIENGAVDGFVFGSPFSTMAVSKGVAQMLADPMKGELPEFRGLPYQIVATSQQTLESKPEVIRKALRALAKAQKMTREKPEEARRVTRSYFANLSDAEYNAEFDLHVTGIPAQLAISDDQFTRTQKLMNLTEKEKYETKFAEVVSSSLADQVAKEIPAK
jgi:NitT/TauT family transport system substrate-binding protein